jgi:hypothetical protein
MAFTATQAVDADPISPAYIQSAEQGWKNTQGAYAVRATEILADISQSQDVSDYKSSAAGLVQDGMYEGSMEQSSHYLSWAQNVERQHTEIVDTGLEDLNVSTVNLTVETESRFTLEMKDRNRTFRTVDRTYIHGVEDPLLAGIGIQRDINACSFDRLADRAYMGTVSNGTARGTPVVEPSDPSNPGSRGQKVLVTSDITQYSGQESTTDDYAGYYSQNEPSDPGSYNDVYTAGGSGVPEFENNQRAIIHEGIWESNFFRTRDNECYLPTAHIDTPSIAERIEGETRGSTSQGTFTVLNVGSNSESEVGYERADSSGLSLVQIEGVSTGQGEIWSNFRMSQGLADEIGISALIN